jgi:hypothetical protein
MEGFKMPVRPSADRIIVTLERDIIAFVDELGFQRERERSWIVEEALRRWRHRLERERQKRRDNRSHALAALGLSSSKEVDDVAS